jgi:mannose-6-phosphate isomerase-like protein (cupin superfamily)
MESFVTRTLSPSPDAMAPDGSEVRVLAVATRGSMAQFTLPAGRTSKAVAHKTVEEVWYFVGGRGRMWRRLGDHEETVDVFPGISISIPVGAHFQFRSDGNDTLAMVGVTMPPWPGPDEAYEVEGPWPATV